MIKIIYRDLSPGLHASAETAGRDTVISLLPGLTPEQRRAALRRIRHSGRMGHGPRVSAPQLGLALALDRIKAITRTGAAVVRLHPAGSTLPVLLLSTAAVVFVLMATVSIHVVPAPKSSDQAPVVGGLIPGSPSSGPRLGAGARGVAPSIGYANGLPGAGGVSPGSPSPAGRGAAGAHGRAGQGTPGSGQLGSLTGTAGTYPATIGPTGPATGGSVNPGGTVGTASGSGSSGRSSGSGATASSPGSPGSSGSGTTAGSGRGPTGSGSTSASVPASTGSSGSGAGSSGTGSTGGSGGSGSSGGSGGGSCANVLSLVQVCLNL